MAWDSGINHFFSVDLSWLKTYKETQKSLNRSALYLSFCPFCFLSNFVLVLKSLCSPSTFLNCFSSKYTPDSCTSQPLRSVDGAMITILRFSCQRRSLLIKTKPTDPKLNKKILPVSRNCFIDVHRL